MSTYLAQRLLLSTALLATTCSPAYSGESYAGLGTTGIELGYAYKPSVGVGIRAEANFLNYGRDFNSNGANYTAKLKFSNLGAFCDYFPLGTFRLTGGVLLGSRKLEGIGVTTGGTVTINGTAYPAPAGESVTVTDTFPSAAPYLGIGFGHGQPKSGLGFYFDAGAAFGKSDVGLSVTPGLLSAAGQSNIDAERTKLREKLDRLKVYPVIKLGVSYTY